MDIIFCILSALRNFLVLEGGPQRFEYLLEIGSVFTFEPGLYYPDEGSGWGMRIEDVYYVAESGEIENLTNFPRDLVVEI